MAKSFTHQIPLVVVYTEKYFAVKNILLSSIWEAQFLSAKWNDCIIFHTLFYFSSHMFKNVPVCFQHFKTRWIFYKILPPIWTDMNLFQLFKSSTLLSVTKTSASNLLSKIYVDQSVIRNFHIFRNVCGWKCLLKSV